jgi:cardiolipin synthase
MAPRAQPRQRAKSKPTAQAHVQAFGKRMPLPEFLRSNATIFGVKVPVAGIVMVVVLTLVAITLWGIVFTRAPRLLTAHIEHRYDAADPAFLRSMGVLLGPPLAPGNRIDTLVNGDEIFPAMLEAIRSARKTITFETYIYWKGEVGQRFAEALAERARHGVKVHVLLDWVGSHKMDDKYRNEMGAAGAAIMRYHQPKWFRFRHVNERTHRKLLVVDGTVGFTGGVGIADEWSGHAQDPAHWRDTHFRVEGPVVSQLQAAFADNWVQATGEVLHGDEYFPQLSPAGGSAAQVFKSSINGGAESMQLMYMLSIVAAKSSIDLAMAYFIPDDLALEHLVAALRRGVRVRILVPGEHTDSKMVRRASRAHWQRLLAAGAEIYEYAPTMYHCKVMVVDGVWASVGSTNFDTRSFRLNAEANLNVYDPQFARRQTADFERDLGRAHRVTLAEYEARPWYEAAWESMVAFFEPTLGG